MSRERMPDAASFLTAVLALLAGSTCLLAADQPQRWAVLIGIDDYAHARDLKYCGADERALEKELIVAGFPQRQVVLLHDDAKEKQFLPFKSNIEKQIELVCGLAQPGDLVLISFSGHGVHVGTTSYLCTTDANTDDPETLISLDWVYD